MRTPGNDTCLPKFDGVICLLNKCVTAFAMVILILAMHSAVVYVLIRIISIHRHVFQESYNSLKMARGKSKVSSVVLFIAVYLLLVATGVRHIAMVNAQLKLCRWERGDFLK